MSLYKLNVKKMTINRLNGSAMFSTLLLFIHILAGVLALLLGIGAMTATKKKGGHTQLGTIYHACFAVIAISASLLALLNWERLWWFLPIAIFSYLFALLGFLSGKLKFKNWLRFHLLGQGGSFIAMCTAIAVVNFGSVSIFAWIVPTLIGAPLITWLSREIKAGRRPKY